MLHDFARTHQIAEDDRQAFVERAHHILLELNDGTAGRYGITPDELTEWLTHSANPQSRKSP